MPRPASTEKTPRSKAVCELRALLGDSQQAFSNRLGIAMQTIARYETSGPPNGDALLMLADVAEQHRHYLLRDFFRMEWVEDFFKQANFNVLWTPAQGSEPAKGYLMLRLRGDGALQYAQSVLLMNALRESPDPKVRKKVEEAIAAHVAVTTALEPFVSQMQEAFRVAGSGASQESKRTTNPNKPKSGRRKRVAN